MPVENNSAVSQFDVMIVDDDPDDLNLLADILKKNNYQVTLAADAELALTSIKAKQPFLILLDVQLPGMSGYELCKLLKKDVSTKEIPVVFLCSHTSLQDKIMCFEAGGVDYISKPIIIEEVLARVNTHLTSRKLQLESEEYKLILQKEIEEHKKTEEELHRNYEQVNSLLEKEKTNKRALLNILKDQKEVLSSLKESEERLSIIADTTNAVLYRKYTGSQYDYINPAVEKLTGYSPDEINNIGFASIVEKIEEADGKEVNREELKSNQKKIVNEFHADYLIRTKDGSSKWLADVSYPWFDDNGALIGSLGILMDITQRKEMVQELITAKNKAEEMNKVKSSFLSNMSHELRTPLISILGFSEILADELENPDYIKMVNSIAFAGERLKRTLNTILDLSKVEANEIVLLIEEQNVVELVQNNAIMFLGPAQKKGLYLNVVALHTNLTANIDKRIFLEILNNLLSNAIIYTETGGITVEIGQEKVNGKDWLCVSVADTGKGVDKKDFGLIFEEFRQVSEGFSRTHEGTGLGLTLVKKYVDLMGGVITLESELGVGSTFTVKVPLL